LTRTIKVREAERMKQILRTFIYIHTAEEHRVTRWMLTLTSLVTGWTIAGMMHGFGVLGF
jgi:hypothetical protein